MACELGLMHCEHCVYINGTHFYIIRCTSIVCSAFLRLKYWYTDCIICVLCVLGLLTRRKHGLQPKWRELKRGDHVLVRAALAVRDFDWPTPCPRALQRG
jgi:hypothetical protein